MVYLEPGSEKQSTHEPMLSVRTANSIHISTVHVLLALALRSTVVAGYTGEV